ncbi:adenylate cyclase [Garicola koreensis]|uniref:Adenylate cyclase n=2 Tax=Garicola koreensis TaxID=1262554 RepID=A0A7W5U306_9MICC|nr:adenylate cyclase [Garicola koreensis]
MAPTEGPTDFEAVTEEGPDDAGRASWERARRRGFGAAGPDRWSEDMTGDYDPPFSRASSGPGSSNTGPSPQTPHLPDYMADEGAGGQAQSDAGAAEYSDEELAAARADWSDFPAPRGHGPLLTSPVPRVPNRGFTPGPQPQDDGEREDPQYHRSSVTAAIPIPGRRERDWHGNIRKLEHQLLGAERTLTYRQMASRMGVSTHSARRLWRALGFPNLDEDIKAFTEADADALARMVELVRDGHLNQEAAISLTRSVGQMTDRMVVWQIEALVEDKIANERLTDAQARSQVVEELPQLIEPVQQLMNYAWRRQLSAALQRLTVRVESGLASLSRSRDGTEDDAPLPLARAVGFADLVSYTSLSRQMNERTLAQMVQRFESRCAEIISIGGGRLVKTVGDEVLYNAETPEAGAEIALALSESMAADDVLPQARVSVVWGRVLSRMGDIYGPTVNLAARLTGIADPGTVLVDEATAEALEVTEDYLLVPQPPRLVRGFGEVSPHLLLRANGSGISLDSH